MLTARKAVNLVRYMTRERHGGGLAHAPTGGSADSTPDAVAAVAAAGPPPDVVAEVTEGCARLLEVLKDEETDELYRVAVWKLEGYTNAEIGEKLGRSVRSVERKLGATRRIWEREGVQHS